MKKYLSIGEVSKAKGISHRALRHYDDLGILVPVYVNPDTNYRYYSKNQMIVLDIIMLCVALDIPLKQFKTYMLASGSIDVQKMVEDAKQKAVQVQKDIEQKLYFLESASSNFVNAQQIIKQNKSYTKHIKTRYFLTASAPVDLGTYENYWAKLTGLYKLASEQGFALSVNQGFCFLMQDGMPQAKYYVEIKQPEKTHADILVISEAEFLCEYFEDDNFFETLEKYQRHKLYLAGNMLILSEVLECKIGKHLAPFEAQLLL